MNATELAENERVCEFSRDCRKKACIFRHSRNVMFSTFKCNHSRDFNPSGRVRLFRRVSIEEADAIMESLQ